MASQKRPRRNADPFAVMPYPKSYYMPSLTKDVNKREAIQGPERKLTKSKREEAEERFIFGSDTLRATAMASGIQALGGTEEFVVNTSVCQTSLESERLEESWPGSDASPDLTRHTDHDHSALTDSSNVGYDLDTKDSLVVKQNGGNARLQDEPTESVLQRYIERFRNSDPKPREERLKERMRQQQEFWWLRRASPGLDGADSAAQRGQRQCEREVTSLSEPNASARLTQEALQAMDEDTLKLQRKADMLLSQSELSFASSDPIVSTEGLGTTRSSASVSDFSVMDEQVPYRPSFVPIQEKMYNSRSQSLPNHRAPHPRLQGHHTEGQRSGADDILSRWRLRRKMEDTPPTQPYGGARSTQLGSQPTSLDPRLEEFRKKLFSQKAAIIKQDIDFERQKMKLYLDDDDDVVAKTVTMPASSEASKVSTTDEVDDPVLRRLRQVTGGSGGKAKLVANDSNCSMPYQSVNNQNSVCAPTNSDSSSGVHHVNNNSEYGSTDFQRNSDNRDFNSNNIQNGRFDDEIHKRGVNLVGGLDVNNTALNGDDNSEGCEHDMGGVSVDVFDSQVICDPKERVFSLHSSQNSISMVSDKVQDMSKQQSVDISHSSKNQNSKNNASLCYENVIPLTSGSLEHQSVKHSEVDCFHQVLEAEKPNEDSDQSNSTHCHMEREHDNSNHSSLSRNKIIKKPLGSKEEGNVTRVSNLHTSKEKRNKNTKSKQHQFESDDETFVSNSSDIEETSKASSVKSKQDKKEVRRHQRALADTENMQPNKMPDKKDDRVSMSEKATLPALQPCSSPAPPGKGTGRQPMLTAIGQTVADHLFDGSVMMSSVDSWSSMFPQSPARSRTLHETVLCGGTPSPPRRDHSPKQSTPICKEQSIAEVPEDMDESSEEEFTDDPLLALLRQQRAHYLEQLRQIELKLQDKRTWP